MSTRHILALMCFFEATLHFVYGFDIFLFLFGINFDFHDLQLPYIVKVIGHFYDLFQIFFAHFVIYALFFCFVDPFTYEHFTNWVIATFLPFFNACLNFALWMVGMCKTVFQMVQTKVQNFFALLYNFFTQLMLSCTNYVAAY